MPKVPPFFVCSSDLVPVCRGPVLQQVRTLQNQAAAQSTGKDGVLDQEAFGKSYGASIAKAVRSFGDEVLGADGRTNVEKAAEYTVERAKQAGDHLKPSLERGLKAAKADDERQSGKIEG